jgi:single-strand DNA-binding protein
MSSEQNGDERKGSGGASVNKSTIVGNVGMPPEWKHKEGQTPFCVFTVGVSRGRRVGDRYETLWYRVTLWGKLAENAVKYLLKSQQVYVEGRLVVSDWTDREGRARYTHELAASDFQMLGDPMDALGREAERLERRAIEEEGRGSR